MVQLPSDWQEQLVARMVRDKPGLVVPLRLSYDPRFLPGRLAEAGTGVQELADELRMIVSFDQDHPSARHPDPAYQIRTPWLWLRVRNFDRDGVLIAQIVGVRVHEAKLAAMPSPLLSADICSVDDLVPFDLRKAHSAYRSARTRTAGLARKIALSAQPPTMAGTRLADLDRRLRCALAVLELLGKREEVLSTARMEGVVVDRDDGQSGPDVLKVQLGAASGAFVEDTNVLLEFAATTAAAEIVDTTGDSVLVRPKGNADLHRLLSPGSAVTVVRKGKSKNDSAVTSAIGRVRRGEVAGDWHSLIDLLVAPESLPSPEDLAYETLDPQPDEERVRLSAEQERVVRRALSAPHAFFVHGPPGTGKTTVIAEIIRHLAARGERVLLAAPMHVAVDEVLHRLRDDPRIWPMRVAADPKNIRPGLEHLRESTVRTDALERLATRPQQARASWAEESTDLVRRSAALDRLTVAADANASAESAFTRLRTRNLPGRLARQASRLEEELIALAPQIDIATRAEAEAAQLAAQAALLTPELDAARADAARAADRYTELDLRLQNRRAALHMADEAAQAAAQSLQAAVREVADFEARASVARISADNSQLRLAQDSSTLSALLAAVAGHDTRLRRAREAELQATDSYKAAYRASRLGAKLAVGISRGPLSDPQDLMHSWQRERVQADAAHADGMRAVAAQQARMAQEHDRLNAARYHLAQLAGSLNISRANHVTLTAHANSTLAAMAAHHNEVTAAAGALAAQRRTHDWLLDTVRTLAERQQAAHTAHHAATAAHTQLESAKNDLDQKLAGTQRRLVAAAVDLETAADTAAARAQDLNEARSTASEACGGEIPDDPSADSAAAHTRIDRLLVLLRLSARWQDLLSPAEPEHAPPAEELSQVLLGSTNLVCATVAGIHGSPSAGKAQFDTLILDEASRVVDADLLVPAVRARRWILVGDERQLPPYVDQETEQHVHALLALRAMEAQGATTPDAAVAAIAATRDPLVPQRPIRLRPTCDLATALLADGSWQAHYRDHLATVLARLTADLDAAPAGPGTPGAETELLAALATGRSTSTFEKCVNLPGTADVTGRLTVQRRMVTPIAELVNVPVYGGDYRSPDPQELAARRIVPFTGPEYPQPVVFYDTHRSPKSDRIVGTGFVNDLEADLVINVLHIWDQIAGQPGRRSEPPSFSVLSFYKAQAALIERRLALRPLKRLRRNVIDSVDKIQGQESDLVVISFVRALRNSANQPRHPAKGTLMWLQDIHRLNVAVTRARLALALVGDRPTLERLTGDEAAGVFYKNLFTGLEQGAPGMLYVVDSSS